MEKDIPNKMSKPTKEEYKAYNQAIADEIGVERYIVDCLRCFGLQQREIIVEIWKEKITKEKLKTRPKRSYYKWLDVLAFAENCKEKDWEILMKTDTNK